MSTYTYPIRLDGNGGLQLDLTYPDMIRTLILSVLSISRGELLYEPDYGLEDRVFQLAIVRSLSSVRTALDSALSEYSDVTYILQGEVKDGGRLRIVVTYSIGTLENKVEVVQ